MLAHNTEVRIWIEGVEATLNLGALLKSLRYTDTIESESDTCELTFYDEKHKLLKGGVPLRGSSIELELKQGDKVFNLGNFELDAIDYKSPPSECTLKLNSVPNSAKVRGEPKYRAWEQVTLKKIAQDIAYGAGLQLYYEVEEIEFVRAEQSGESDLAFLNRLCRDNGLGLKVANKRIIIFDAAKFESKAPVDTIALDSSKLKNFNSNAKITAIYGDAEVNYTPSAVSDWLFSFFGDNDFIKTLTGLDIGLNLNNGADSMTLKIFENVNSDAEAERLAKGRLRDKNKNEWTLNLTLTGDFSYAAGQTLALENFGYLNGKYMIKTATHSLNQQGYVMQLQMNRCLNY